MKKSTMVALGLGAGAVACTALAVHFWGRKKTGGAVACGIVGGCAAAAAAGCAVCTLRKSDELLLAHKDELLFARITRLSDAGQTEKGTESSAKRNSSFIENQNSSRRKVVIGITTSDSFQGKIVGEHAFIMCIDADNPARSVMLDASGHYGSGRTSDVIDGHQMNITVEDYLKYWDTDENLTTFELRLSESEERRMRNAILEVEDYSWMSCASRASEILNENYSEEIKRCRTPKGLLDTLNRFARKYPNKATVRYFDLKADKEILGAEN